MNSVFFNGLADGSDSWGIGHGEDLSVDLFGDRFNGIKISGKSLFHHEIGLAEAKIPFQGDLRYKIPDNFQHWVNKGIINNLVSQ